MVNETQSGPRTRAPDDLVVPALVVGASVALARRALARSRRIPGLSLFLFGAGRGRVKTAAPHVPALPWSVGLSPILLWTWATRGDRGQRSSFEAARQPAAIRSFDPSAPRKVDAAVPRSPLPSGSRPRDLAPQGTTPTTALASGAPPAVGPGARPSPERASDRLHPLPNATGLEVVSVLRAIAEKPPIPGPSPRFRGEGSTTVSSGSAPLSPEIGGKGPGDRGPARQLTPMGLEAVAPALVLVRSLLGAPTGQAPSRSSAAPGGAAPSSMRRRGPGGFSFAASVAAARTVIVRVAPTENAGRAGIPMGVKRAIAEKPPNPGPSPRFRGEGSTAFSSGSAPLSPEIGGKGPGDRGPARRLTPMDAPPVTTSLSSAPSSAALPSPAAASPAATSPARRSERAAPASPEALPWIAPTVPRVGVDARVEPAASFAERGRSIDPAEDHPELRAPVPVLPWGAPSIARSRAELGPPTPDAPLRLPQRDAHAVPVAMKRLVEVADSLRTFVTREVQEAKEAVSRAASRRLTPLPEPSFTPTDDAIRKLLSRMRTIMQEERFRSGKIR